MKSETTAVKQSCEKCGDAVDHFSADPGLWPVWLCGPGSNGVAKVYHQKCVSISTDEVDYLRSHVTKIDEENTQLRADNARLKSRVEGYEKQWTYMDYTISKCLEELTTYKAAVVEAREALEYVGCHEHGDNRAYPPTESHKVHRCEFCHRVDHALHTLSALTGDATKPT